MGFRTLSCKEQDQVVWSANVDLDLCATELSKKKSHHQWCFWGHVRCSLLLTCWGMNFGTTENPQHCSPNPGHDQEQPFLGATFWQKNDQLHRVLHVVHVWGVVQTIPSRELTYPTCGKGKSSSKVPFYGDMLVPRRVVVSTELIFLLINIWEYPKMWSFVLPTVL